VFCVDVSIGRNCGGQLGEIPEAAARPWRIWGTSWNGGERRGTDAIKGTNFHRHWNHIGPCL